MPAIRILHLSDTHMGSGLVRGHTDPETGINTRLQDFITTLGRCIDRALAEPVDLVLFGGDAFPDATPPPFVQEAFAAQFCRLAIAGIPTVLLVGNHDQHSQGKGGASLSIYRTLGVPGFIVGDTLTTHRIATRNGDIQVVTLPWLTRSTLLTRTETEGLALSEIHALLIERLQPALEGEIRRLDPTVPTVLLAHLMADRAELGAERYLAVGKGFTVPLSLLARPEFEYVALGHVHRHQNLNPADNPPVVYPGSIERVDFSEEREDKGFVLIDVERGRTRWEFCTLPVRTFRTIEVDTAESSDPQSDILKAIAACDIADTIVRLIYKLRADRLDTIDTNALQQALSTAHSYTIRPELVSQLARPRLPELGDRRRLTPLDALQVYLTGRDDLRDIADEMLDATRRLLDGDSDTVSVDAIKFVPDSMDGRTQLRLL
ncbi:exonuclease SbcD [Rubidibacter lacunae KORDI 51-2]|uniref:Nuclease SbcCD subunit D n=1 Tax=Rubidibacter lacunae KORDI 51-2 TaxID=582515 RepID=U5DK07_9CHRO|nr:exonuclease subunit SbcD [Rubidibacter lacunae]ERN41242.1 exonuclease SbcD [Rubidibacter lacunae KORDI 51-2]